MLSKTIKHSLCDRSASGGLTLLASPVESVCAPLPLEMKRCPFVVKALGKVQHLRALMQASLKFARKVGTVSLLKRTESTHSRLFSNGDIIASVFMAGPLKDDNKLNEVHV